MKTSQGYLWLKWTGPICSAVVRGKKWCGPWHDGNHNVIICYYWSNSKLLVVKTPFFIVLYKTQIVSWKIMIHWSKRSSNLFSWSQDREHSDARLSSCWNWQTRKLAKNPDNQTSWWSADLSVRVMWEWPVRTHQLFSIHNLFPSLLLSRRRSHLSANTMETDTFEELRRTVI